MTDEKKEIEKAIEHFKYGVTHDIFNEPVTTYAILAVIALERMAYEEANTKPEGRRFIRGNKTDKELADEVFYMTMSFPIHQKYLIWELVGRFKTLHNQKIGKYAQRELLEKIASFLERDGNWEALKACCCIDGRSDDLRKLLHQGMEET